jgi:hypothetical protein
MMMTDNNTMILFRHRRRHHHQTMTNKDDDNDYWSIFLGQYSCPSSEYRPKYRFASEGNRSSKIIHEIREKANGLCCPTISMTNDHGTDAALTSEE